MQLGYAFSVNLYHQLKDYFTFYNVKRRHQGIDNQIPQERYQKQINIAA
jgi:putative transposase